MMFSGKGQLVARKVAVYMERREQQHLSWILINVAAFSRSRYEDGDDDIIQRRGSGMKYQFSVQLCCCNYSIPFFHFIRMPYISRVLKKSRRLLLDALLR